MFIGPTTVMAISRAHLSSALPSVLLACPASQGLDAFALTPEWNHGEARCPSCGLHLSRTETQTTTRRKNSDARAVGAFVTHRRCGAKVRIEFAEP